MFEIYLKHIKLILWLNFEYLKHLFYVIEDILIGPLVTSVPAFNIICNGIVRLINDEWFTIFFIRTKLILNVFSNFSYFRSQRRINNDFLIFKHLENNQKSSKIRDTVTCVSVLASGTQPPASVTNFIQFALCQKCIDEDRQTESGMEAAHHLKI